MLDLAAALHALADRLDVLDVAEALGELEVLRVHLWRQATAPVPSAAPLPEGRPPLTVAAVAPRIGFSKDVVYEMLRRGELPNVGRGRAKRVPAAAVAAWLECRPAGSPSAVASRYSRPHDAVRGTGAAGPPGPHAEKTRRRARRGADDGRAVGARRQRRQCPGADEPDAPGAATWALPPRRRPAPRRPPEA